MFHVEHKLRVCDCKNVSRETFRVHNKKQQAENHCYSVPLPAADYEFSDPNGCLEGVPAFLGYLSGVGLTF